MKKIKIKLIDIYMPFVTKTNENKRLSKKKYRTLQNNGTAKTNRCNRLKNLETS